MEKQVLAYLSSHLTTAIVSRLQKVIIVLVYVRQLAAIPVPSDFFESHLPIKRETNQRYSHAPLISGDTFRAICDLVYDETIVDFDLNEVFDGMKIFVGRAYLKNFLANVIPLIHAKCIIVTSNGDGTIDESYRHFLNHDKILRLFGRNLTIQHPKAKCIPLGVCWWQGDLYYHILREYLNRLNREQFFVEKPTYAYCNLEITHFSRETLLDGLIPRTKRCDYRIPFYEYMQEMERARFIYSPRGYNIDCYRTWEALYAGSIPIVESHGIDSLYEKLPVIIVKSFQDVTESFLEQEYEKLKTQDFDLTRLTAEYWIEQIEQCQLDYFLSK